MKNDSKSGLNIQQIIIAAIILLVASFSMGTANLRNSIQVANLSEQEKIIQENAQEAIQVAQTSEENIKTTSRSSEERAIVEGESQEQTADINEQNVEKLIQEATTENSEQNLEMPMQEEITKVNEQNSEMSVKENVITEETLEENASTYISIEEITISKDMDLTQRCGVSKDDFVELMANLKTDTSGFFGTNSELIYDLCEQYELNEIFFCGLIAGESGWNIASNHRNTNNYISMMSGGRLIRYSTVEEGLEAATKLLHNKYLTEGGSCYYGKTLSCVQKRFCPNSSTWVGLIYKCMSQIVK